MAMSDITVVIPAKNEGPTIAAIVSRCRMHAHEVLVLDGHSEDDTGAASAGAGARVIRDKGRGKGAAIRQSVEHITSEIVVFMDADGSHDPKDIPRLVAPIREGWADHVSASRLIGGSSELHGSFDEFFRLAGSAFITACINWRFGVKLSESQNGFRAIRTSVLRQLDLREDITTIEQEMIIKTLRAGFRVVDIPSHEHSRLHGESHIHLWRVAPRYVLCLIRCLFGGWRERGRKPT